MRAIAGFMEQVQERPQLLLPPDEAGRETAELGAGAGEGGGRDPRLQGLALALQRDGVTGIEREHLLGCGMGGPADGDGHRRGRGLQTGRHVDRIPGEEALAARGVDVEPDQRVACVHPDADLSSFAADAGQRVDLVDQPQAGAHRPLGVVLVQGGDAEDGDHSVADVLSTVPP